MEISQEIVEIPVLIGPNFCGIDHTDKMGKSQGIVEIPVLIRPNLSAIDQIENLGRIRLNVRIHEEKLYIQSI